MAIIYEHSEVWDAIPADHEYRQEDGRPSVYFLCDVGLPNQRRAKEFECALNAVAALGIHKDVRISWKIEENEKAF